MTYEGHWEYGRFKGYGKITLANGEVREGYFNGSQLFENEEKYKQYLEELKNKKLI